MNFLYRGRMDSSTNDGIANVARENQLTSIKCNPKRIFSFMQ